MSQPPIQSDRVQSGRVPSARAHSDRVESDRDDALFDVLYETHHRVLYAYLLGQTGDREAAEDLLQETFVRVWQHLSAVEAIPEERRRFWLFATARNLIRDACRRRQVRAPYSGTLPEAFQAESRMEDPADTVVRRELATALEAAIRDLPPDLRTVLTLHRVGEMTSAEIGRTLSRPAGTIRYQLALARRRLAQAIGLCEIRGTDAVGTDRERSERSCKR